jgi:hypothetical protein
MTFIGKIFTVLIFIMSIVFMSLSLMVFATHKNWKLIATNAQPGPGQPLGYKQQLEQRQQEIKKLRDEKAKFEELFAAERAARTYIVASLNSKLTQLDGQLKQKETELTKLQGAHTEQTTALQTLENNNKALIEEVAQLRDNIKVAQQDRDAQFTEVVRLTDVLHTTTGELRVRSERVGQLVDVVASQKRVMDKHGLTPFSLVRQIEPKVDGVVLAVGAKDMIEVSLGADDGLKEGHKMEVFRGATYLGRIVIIKTEATRAIGRLVPEYKKGDIRKDDRVTTRLS